MPDLSVTVDGLTLPNPFLIASGPPSTNANVIAKAFDEGWGGVVSKTTCLKAETIINVSPRYARMRAESTREVLGWQNIELISDRPFKTWLQEFRQLKDQYPDKALIASIMEECNRDAWLEIVQRVQETGVDALELNLSCPHGLPERAMGSAMGQSAAIVEEVCGWVMEVAKVPVWAKMTPNITDVTEPARAALQAGCQGISAINTVLCVMGVNLDTLRPEPTVEGYSEPGGFSYAAIRPIALRMVMEIARMSAADYPDRSVSGIGGITTGEDAAQFLLLGANTAQVCTGVMVKGFGLIHELTDALARFMDKHGFASVEEFRGRSLPYFTTHAELVRMQAEARQARREAAAKTDDHWTSDQFVQMSSKLVDGN